MTRFGDGYTQRSSDGINPVRRDWTLVFGQITDATSAAIDSFLEANVGQSITWTPPGGTALKFVCNDWSRQVNGPDKNQMQAVFEQVFE